MAILEYPKYVLRNRISCQEDTEFRYILKIPFTLQPKNTVTVILKNPSTATANESDVTADRVVRYAYKRGFDRVIIVNLFAYRATDSTVLKHTAKQRGLDFVVGNKNDELIVEAIEEASRVIVAWGSPPQGFKRLYDKRIERILKVLPNKFCYVDRISDKGFYPLHGQIWGYDMKLKEYVR